MLSSTYLDNDAARGNVFKAMTQDLCFQSGQIARVLDLFHSPAAKGDVVYNIFTSVTDRKGFHVVEEKLTPAELDRLQDKMGDLYFFDAENPTGRYELDCSKKRHVEVLQRLIAINNDQKYFYKEQGAPDTSQKGNRQLFRNETVDGVPWP